MRIGERVRAAHLSNHCPGGLGFPVTSSGRAGTDPGIAPRSWLIIGDHEARAAGEVCARCRQLIAPNQNVRCRGDGDWVHESCPQLRRAATGQAG